MIHDVLRREITMRLAFTLCSACASVSKGVSAYLHMYVMCENTMCMYELVLCVIQTCTYKHLV